MNWYYVDAGRQTGPVGDAKLAELARRGIIQADTLVWHEGMSSWTRYAEAAPASATVVPPTTAQPSGGVICSECGGTFASDKVIRHGDKWVCAACQPIFFQKLSEGAALPATAPGVNVSEADLLARDYEVDIGGCLSRAWEVFKSDAALIIGTSVLVYLAILAANAVPYLSVALALVFNGPLMGGLWLFYLKKERNEEAALGDAFGGFGPKFWQLVLARLIPAAIALGFVILIAVVAALTVPAVVQIFRHQDGDLRGIAPAALIPVGVVSLVFMVVMLYLNTCWLFALPLVGDKGLKFWPALQLSRKMVHKHWWMTFWLLAVCGIIGVAGLCVCCVGVLVSGPVAFAMIVAHYQKVFGDLTPV